MYMIPVLGQGIDLGTQEFNTMAKDLGHVTMYFFTLSMYEVHVIQNVVVVEMKTRESALVNQVKSSYKNFKKLNNTV